MTSQDKPKSYMQELDHWTHERVIEPLLVVWSAQEDGDPKSEEATELACQEVRKAIREKVLESYRNGQKAGQRPRR